jgi:hypothetical protein
MHRMLFRIQKNWSKSNTLLNCLQCYKHHEDYNLRPAFYFYLDILKYEFIFYNILEYKSIKYFSFASN